LLIIWSMDAPNRQDQVTFTMVVLGVALILTLLWLLLFSRLRARTRGFIAAALSVIAVASALLFRVRGFSGDLIPIVELRQTQPAPLPAPASSLSTKEKIAPASSATSAAKPAPQTTIEAPKKTVARTRVAVFNYPQFLGPERNAIVYGIKLARDWQAHPARLVWRKPVGEGWSAFAVFEGNAITQEQHGEHETVTCYDLQTGARKWQHRDGTKYESPMVGNGPRATPTIDNGRVHTFGATGRLNCLELSSGKLLWTRDVVLENEGEIKEWGMSISPLVCDSLVLVSTAGKNENALAAYHAQTGALVWSAGNERASYSSPLLATIAGEKQILIFHHAKIVAHAPTNGARLWEQEWPKETQCVAQPLVLPEGRVLVASGYGIGCKLFQISRDEQSVWSSALVWESTSLKAKFANVVAREGFVYGLDDGILVCIDLASGARKWKRGRYGHGQLILVDDVLLIQAESGEVVLVEANPEAHVELGKFTAFESKTWNSPALAAPYLLVRNDREAACYELALSRE
jgi:outer membrane protein assembly factor BamB